MKLTRFFEVLAMQRRSWRASRLFIEATNDMVDKNYALARDKLERACSDFPNKPEQQLVMANCCFKLQDIKSVEEILASVEVKIANSKRSVPSRRYLELYASYLSCFLADGSDRDAALEGIRNEAATLRDKVPKRYLRYLPIQ